MQQKGLLVLIILSCATGTYLGCRSELDGCIAAIHHTLFGKRHDSLSHIPRNTD